MAFVDGELADSGIEAHGPRVETKTAGNNGPHPAKHIVAKDVSRLTERVEGRDHTELAY